MHQDITIFEQYIKLTAGEFDMNGTMNTTVLKWDRKLIRNILIFILVNKISII